MTSARRGAALLAVALSLPACNLTFTTTDDSFGTSAAPQDPFALQIPLNDANGVQPINTQFAWGALAGAVSYELEISLSADFSQIVHTQSGITITQVFSNATLTYSTTYYWRIRGFDTSSSRLAARAILRQRTDRQRRHPDPVLQLDRFRQRGRLHAADRHGPPQRDGHPVQPPRHPGDLPRRAAAEHDLLLLGDGQQLAGILLVAVGDLRDRTLRVRRRRPST
jgi:hypothetical protein